MWIQNPGCNRSDSLRCATYQKARPLPQHQLIAGTEHGLAHGVVGASYAVEACLLHYTATSLLRRFKGRGSDDSVIMVDAGAAKLKALAVHTKSVHGVHIQAAESELFPLLRPLPHRFKKTQLECI